MKKSKGFTIIELVITIFILSIGIIGVFSAFSVVTILTSDTADRLTAAYLAQEGIEIVRNIRDTNWLRMDFCITNSEDPDCIPTPTWLDGLNLTACSTPTQGCQADYASTSISPFVSGNYLYLDSSNNFYGYGSGTKTKFERKIITECLPESDCATATDYIMKVIIQVSWDKKASILNGGHSADSCIEGDNCIIAETTLYDWYNYSSTNPE